MLSLRKFTRNKTSKSSEKTSTASATRTQSKPTRKRRTRAEWRRLEQQKRLQARRTSMKQGTCPSDFGDFLLTARGKAWRKKQHRA